MAREKTYKIRRFYRDGRPARTVRGKTGLTLKEAQAHCRDPKTRGEDRNGQVIWLDGYTEE
jgi:hypothetical protein